MFKALVRSRFSSLLASLRQSGKSGKKKSRVSPALMILLFVIIGAYFLATMGAMFYGLCFLYRGTGQEWQVFLLGVMISSALCVFGSIFVTKTQIFDSKDNELLLSMPIPPKYIFLSRMLTLLVVNYLLESVVMLPCIVMYGILCGYSTLGLIFSILTFLLIPFLTLSVSAIIAWIVSEIASRLRNKTVVTVALFIIFFGAYMYLCFNMGYTEGAAVDLSGFRGMPVFGWAADACANGEPLSMLWFFLCAALPALITFLILDKSFIRIITTKKARARVEYRGNREKSSGVYFALLKKELRRFFSSAAYIMNAGMGNVMTVIVAVMIALNSETVATVVAELTYYGLGDAVTRTVPVAAGAIVAFMGSMNLVSAPSISLEDKNLWILQSSPVDPRDVILAKLSCHAVICLPLTLISAVIICFALGLSPIHSALTVLACIVTVAFTDYFGMFLGLKFPKFGWQNENVAVKQGFAVMGTMLGSMFGTMILAGLGMLSAFYISEYLGFAVLILPFAVLSVILHAYLMRGGVRTFDSLKK
jgi:ABC-2 type transport system permease protein